MSKFRFCLGISGKAKQCSDDSEGGVCSFPQVQPALPVQDMSRPPLLV
jgi:hypothetical protein